MEHIQVSARIRPAFKDGKRCVTVDTGLGRVTVFSHDNKPSTFDFTAVFDENSSQDLVYAETAKHVVDGFVTGMNGTVFAYGQTGSGKTYTMLGPELGQPSPQRGVMPRAIRDVFTHLEEQKAKLGNNFVYVVRVSFLELYNERIFDLLNNCEQIEYRDIERREIDIQDSEECLALIREGWAQRKVAPTAMNNESSRSHAIVTLLLLTNFDESGIVQKRSSRLHLVDLAGSERQSETQAVGDRLREACSINKSLSTLCQVIRALSAVRPPSFINFRDSLLTRILQDALGGNSRTSVVVNLHCMAAYFNDTVSTLRFATNVRKIKNNAKVNENISGASADILQAKITELNEALRVAVEARQQAESRALVKSDSNTSTIDESERLMEEREKTEQLKQEMKNTIQDLQEKLAKSEYHRNMLQASNQFLLDGSRSNILNDMTSYRQMLDNQFQEVVQGFKKNIGEGFLSNVSDLDLRRCRDEIVHLKRELDKKVEQFDLRNKEFEELNTELLDLKQRFSDSDSINISPAPQSRNRRMGPNEANSLKRKNGALQLKIVELTQIINERQRYFDEMKDNENNQLQQVCTELNKASGELENVKSELEQRDQQIGVLDNECLRLRDRIQRSDAMITKLSKEKSDLDEYCAKVENEKKELTEIYQQNLANASVSNKNLTDLDNSENVAPNDLQDQYERQLLDAKIALEERDDTINTLRLAIQEKDNSLDTYKKLRRRTIEGAKCSGCVKKETSIRELERKCKSLSQDTELLAEDLERINQEKDAQLESFNDKNSVLEAKIASLTKDYDNVCRELRVIISVVLESTITNTETRFSVFGPGCLASHQSEFQLVCERLKQQRRDLNDFEITRVGLENELSKAERDRDEMKTELDEIVSRQSNLEKMLAEKTKETDELYLTMSDSAGQRNPKQNIRYLNKIRENLFTAEKKLYDFQRACRCNAVIR